ncbi:MAG: CHAT domain-containing tetratricopeptide repeat protein, partial [Burkholderiaceae bacterium]
SLYLRALEIREKALGTKHHDVATSLGSLAALYHSQGQFGKAEPLAQRALAIMEEKLGPDNPDVARSLNNLASIYSAQAQYEQAEPLYMRSLVIWEKSLGGEHPEVARSMGNLAALHVSRGHHKLAEPLFLRSLAIQQSVLGPDHPDAATNLNHLAKLYDSQDRMAQAIDYSRRGFQVVSRRSAAAPEFASSGQAELKSRRRDLAAHIARLYRAQGFALAEESLDAFQLAQASSVGASVAQMAARFAGERGTLAEAIREQQDRAEALVRTERALIRALGQSPAKINPTQVAALREEATTLESALTRLRGEIAARFPEYDALVNPAPIALSEVQKLVRTDEALVLYLTDAAAGTFAWVITRRTFNFFRLEVTEKQIAEHVARLREQLDPVRNPGVQAFDVVAANSLYLQVFAPVESALKGARHVMLVPDGALQSMPFSIMVDRLPNGTRPPSWLIDRFAFSTLPSLSALRALRSFSRATSAKEPFIGFGHPTLQGTSGHPRALTARSLFVPGDAANAASAGRIADVDVIRQAMSLPETAGELYALARTLAAPSASVYLQDRATETNAKRLDLARYRVIAFATHGLVGGEIAGTAEPGLILTPPPTGGSLDDGYLSASEVALLKLNADWVLLSACNTAAPDGTPGAEGLSGLAKAFFYAGARSLLVSNWYVVSDAAVRITTEMLKRHAADPRGGRAEALRLSMQQLRRNPKYSHPLYWAPFIVVGEAGTTSR